MKQVSVGDQQAFATLVKTHTPSLLHFCYSLVRDEELTKDILQSVLIVWWQKASSWDNTKGALITWLHRIAHNKCIDSLRRLKNVPLAEFNEDVYFSKVESA
ncbi:MAG: RNA polymerase sigma-70 factor (ECF subfamily) [Alphaproteobacteria bacterium]|jgi:RNA polymerase sigma-70 factor (ECF subfamily)